MNNYVVVGRLKKMIKYRHTIVLIVKQYVGDTLIKEHELEFELSNNLFKNIYTYCTKGDMVGVKGHIESENHKMKLVADKITFLSKATGEEHEDNNTIRTENEEK